MPTYKSRLSNVAVSSLLRIGDADTIGAAAPGDGIDGSGNFGDAFVPEVGDIGVVAPIAATTRGGVMTLLLPLPPSPLAIFFLACNIAASSPPEDVDDAKEEVFSTAAPPPSTFFVGIPLRRAWNIAANSPPLPAMMMN